MDEILEQIEKTRELRLQTDEVMDLAKKLSDVPMLLLSALAQTRALDAFEAHDTYITCIGENPDKACDILTQKDIHKILDLGKNILNAQLDYRLAVLDLALKIEKNREKEKKNITPDEAKKELRDILTSLKSEIDDILEEDD